MLGLGFESRHWVYTLSLIAMLFEALEVAGTTGQGQGQGCLALVGSRKLRALLGPLAGIKGTQVGPLLCASL